MAERRSLSQGLSVPDQTSFEIEREFVNEGNISRNKERNISLLQKTQTEHISASEQEVAEDIWLPVTFRLPRSLIAELGVFSALQRAKGRKPWKKQEIIAQFLRQGLQRRIDK
jgi:hypothetical protein